MNFLDIQSGVKDRSNSWRNVLAIGVLVVTLGGVGWSFASSFSSGSVADFFVHVAPGGFPLAEDKAVVKAGGDITVAPINVPQPPQLIGDLVPASTFAAEGLLVKDVASGALLYEKHAYDPRPLASITKLMSVLVILEKSPDWATSTIVVSDDVPDTHMYAGDTHTLEELWQAALIGSSNKAILTLADAVGWPRDAFIERMNQKALELGMRDTHFTEPSGLDPGNVSTPSDVDILLQEVLKHEKIQKTLLMKEVQLYSKERDSQHHIWSTDWLLLGWIQHGFADILGGKTGYIPESGYNFTARVADSLGHQLDIVVLGAPTHEERFTVLRDAGEWAFQNYTWGDQTSSSTEGIL